LRDYAARFGIGADYPLVSAVVYRMVWDAPAAAEYPRPILADSADASELAPDLAAEIWHAAAGAIITPIGCDCGTPASHRDRFAELGRIIGARFGVTR
jgi:hypothetical protein